MGFFDALFDSKPSLEPEIGRQVERYAAKFNELFDNNDEALKAYRLPVPECLQGFEYELKKIEGYPDYHKLRLTFPHFRLPSAAFLRIRPELYLVWACEEKLLSEMLDKIKRNAAFYLHRLIDYDFSRPEIIYGWTTQSPYELYKKLSKQEIIVEFNGHEAPKLAERLEGRHNLVQYKKLASIEAIPQVTLEQIAEYEQKMLTFIRLTEKNFYRVFGGGWLGYDGHIQTVSYLLPDFVLETLPPAGFADCFNWEEHLYFPVNFQFVRIVPDGQIKPALMRQFFESLTVLKHPVMFALAAADNTISFELGFAAEDAALVRQQIALHFPDFAVTDFTPEEPEEHNMHNSRCYRPVHAYESLRTLKDFHLDPYRQLCEALTQILDESLEARVEVWCRPFPTEATKAFLNLTDGYSFTRVRPEEYLLPEPKRLEPLRRDFEAKVPAWWACVNIKTTGEYDECEKAQAKLLAALRGYETIDQQWTKVISYMGNLVTLDELAGLAHFPTGELNCDLLEVGSMKQKLPPPLYAQGETAIGESFARGKTQTVYLPEEVRDRHVYLVGKSGTGKSTLLETIARADLEAGFGAAIIDPHGDTIRHLMETMPAHRLADCIYFNPVKSPVSLEILAASSEVEIDLLTDDLVTMFRRTSESWGDKMQAILQMTFQTLLRVPGSSFTDITRLLTDKQYRSQILAGLDHPALAAFWEQRYDVRQAEPILIRMDRLTTSGTLRSVLTQHENSLNFYDVIRQNKIFLADLSKGTLGESTSYLIGSIIVSQIQLAVMRQAQLPAASRIPFSLFVDEVQNFTTEAFSTILSEARKYKLRLTIGHQFVSQLPQDIQKAVFGNVGTLVFFAMSPDDLGAARHELGSYDAGDVANLPKYHALCRPATAARDTFSFAALPPVQVDLEKAEEKVSFIVSHMQQRFKPPVTAPEPAPPDNAPTEEIVIKKTEPVAKIEPASLPPPVVPPEVVFEPPKDIEPIAAHIYEHVTDENEAPPVARESALPEGIPPAVPKKESAERGNAQHRYLQMLVKRIAESRGFQATVEREVFGGVGRIDVALEKKASRIAVEVSVTNEADYEVQNIQKCLAAGYDTVAMISADARHLEKIERRAKETFSTEELSKIMFFSPEEFHAWLEKFKTNSPQEQEKVKGFKVNVKLKPVDASDQTARKKAITDVVLGALKNLKKDDSSK